MKKWLALTLLLFCIPALVWGWGTVIISGSASSGGESYLVHETFDVNPGTDETWVLDLNGTYWDPDYTTSPAPLEGTESLHIKLTEKHVSWPGTDTVYIAFIARFTDLTQTNTMFYFRDGSSVLGRIGVAGDTPYIHYSGDSQALTASTTVNTTQNWYFKVKYVKGTGSDAFWQLWTSTDGSTWTNEGSVSNATDTTQISILRSQCATETIIDDIRVSASDINY